MAKKKKTKKKRSTAQNRKKPAKKNRKRPAVKNRKKKKSGAKHRSAGNPGARLKANIKAMKPGYWYPTTLSGAKVKVKRAQGGIIIKPLGKKR